MIEFSFKGKNSKDFGIYVVEDDRVLRPSLSNNEVIIPKRHGSYDFGNNTYRNRDIILTLGLLKETTPEELRLKMREIAGWLNGKGNLIFSDEPDKHYIAKVYDFVPFTIFGSNTFRDGSFNAGTAQVKFNCFPFALTETKVKDLQVGRNPIKYGGTVETPTLLRITNNSGRNFSQISITVTKRR